LAHQNANGDSINVELPSYFVTAQASQLKIVKNRQVHEFKLFHCTTRE
jgi:hypothetical protein